MEAACEGTGSVTGAKSDGRERDLITGEKSEDERVYPEISGKDTQAERWKNRSYSSRITKLQDEIRKLNDEIHRLTN